MHPLTEAEREIVQAISDIMEKYNLKMKRYNFDDYYRFQLLSANKYIDMENVLGQLLPIEYGKVTK